MLCIKTVNIITPGTIKEPYSIPSIDWILPPIAEPKTTKYNIVEITGAKILCKTVLYVRDISKI